MLRGYRYRNLRSPEGFTRWLHRFQQISSLTSESSLEDIDAHAFRSNHITSVTLPESMRTIGAYAFRANGMRSLTVPETVVNKGVRLN